MAAGAKPGDVLALSDQLAVAEAVAAVDAQRATWTRYDLARQLTLTLHIDRDVDGPALLARVDRLVAGALMERTETLGVVNLSAPPVFETPARLRRVADGMSVYEQHGVECRTSVSVNSERRTNLQVQRLGCRPSWRHRRSP
jgi:hypothetical protein